MKRKPTRRDLLVVIGRLQSLFSKLPGAASDRNPNRASDIKRIADAGLNLAIDALEQDDPITHRLGPWGGDSENSPRTS